VPEQHRRVAFPPEGDAEEFAWPACAKVRAPGP